MTELKTHTQLACLNCGTALNESFCPHCGQREQEVKRPLIGLMKELFHAIFELDGRAYRTVFFLFCKPAHLTREYIEGRRMSFTPPLRLFLILSIIFFFMISANSLIQTLDSSLSGEAGKNNELLAISGSSEEAIDEEQAELNDGFDQVIEFIDNIVVPSLSEETNTNLVAFISNQVQTNFRRIMDDPEDFLYDSLDYITFFMLLMMPFLAMILKVLYFFSKQFYVEHMILTLHNHTFLILAMIIRMPLNLMGEGTLMIISPLANLVFSVVSIWMVIYLFLSLKFYFGQGYWLTTFKFITATILYGLLLAIGFAVFMALFFIFS
ncbi:MAG: hypothetical protein ACJA2Q_002496 [Pseudohongiellaceae bacterium]|jgi:hypothetical protein